MNVKYKIVTLCCLILVTSSNVEVQYAFFFKPGENCMVDMHIIILLYVPVIQIDCQKKNQFSKYCLYTKLPASWKRC